jgi:hypothetical protein
VPGLRRRFRRRGRKLGKDPAIEGRVLSAAGFAAIQAGAFEHGQPLLEQAAARRVDDHHLLGQVLLALLHSERQTGRQVGRRGNGSHGAGRVRAARRRGALETVALGVVEAAAALGDPTPLHTEFELLAHRAGSGWRAVGAVRCRAP